MPITPISPRIGNDRQRQLRELLRRQMARQGQPNPSRFARTGAQRGSVASARGVGAGVRPLIAGLPNRLTGQLDTLTPRGIGEGLYTRIGQNSPPLNPVGNPASLPTDDLNGYETPKGMDFDMGQIGAGQQQSAISGQQGYQSVDFGNQDFGGLIPLGGGAWYDPNTGQIHGAGGFHGIQ